MRGPGAIKVRGIIAAPGQATQYIRTARVNRLRSGHPRGSTANRGILRRVVQQRPLRVARPHSPVGAYVEVHVRSARPTDLDAAVRLLAHDGAGPGTGPDDGDFLRNLLNVPSATIVVAEAGRRLVGVGVLSIRPSVRSGPFVGVIDEMGVAGSELDAAERRHAGDAIVEHLAASAKNKGCTRVEVSEPLASAEPSRWKRLGFASRGRTLGRQIG